MIPANWNNITIETWAALMATIEEKPETTQEIIGHKRRQLMLLTGCEAEKAKAFPLIDLHKVTTLLGTPMPMKLFKKFKLNGIRYRVETRLNRLPNGRVETIAADARILNANQLISAVSTKAKPDRWHQAIFNVCIPYKRTWWLFTKDFEFEDWEVENRIEDFKQLPMETANPIAVFFSSLSKAYLKGMEDYLTEKTMMIQTKLKESLEDLEIDTVG